MNKSLKSILKQISLSKKLNSEWIITTFVSRNAQQCARGDIMQIYGKLWNKLAAQNRVLTYDDAHWIVPIYNNLFSHLCHLIHYTDKNRSHSNHSNVSLYKKKSLQSYKVYSEKITTDGLSNFFAYSHWRGNLVQFDIFGMSWMWICGFRIANFNLIHILRYHIWVSTQWKLKPFQCSFNIQINKKAMNIDKID